MRVGKTANVSTQKGPDGREGGCLDRQDDVREWMLEFAPRQVSSRPGLPPPSVWRDRIRLIRSELAELEDALEARDFFGAVREVVDLLWVVLGTAVALGVRVSDVWPEIRRANHAKEVEAGEVVKPEGWEPPDVEGALSAATKKQPTPRGMGREVTPLVIEDLRERAAIGEAKYGEPLRVHNGRVALVDAYQEALDLVQYLRQAIEEG